MTFRYFSHQGCNKLSFYGGFNVKPLGKAWKAAEICQIVLLAQWLREPKALQFKGKHLKKADQWLKKTHF